MTKGFKKSWRLILITMIIIIFFSILGALPVFERRSYIFTIMGELAILLPVFIGFGHMQKKEDVRDIFTNGFSPVLIPMLILLPFTMQTFVTYVTLPYHAFLQEIFGEYENNIRGADNIKSFIVQFVSICMIPAISEEFLFRGVVMRLLKPYGIALMLVVSSFAFAMLHFSLHSFLVIFMLGMLLGVVRLMTNSVWASVLMHFSNNLLATLSLMIPKEAEPVFFSVVNPISFFLFPIAIALLLRKISCMQMERRTKKVEFSYEMVMCTVIFCMIAVLGI